MGGGGGEELQQKYSSTGSTRSVGHGVGVMAVGEGKQSSVGFGESGSK